MKHNTLYIQRSAAVNTSVIKPECGNQRFTEIQLTLHYVTSHPHSPPCFLDLYEKGPGFKTLVYWSILPLLY